MPDGKNLLFNQDGGIFKISTDGGTPEKLNTGTVDRNNNDHGISFDGKMLAISSSRQGMKGGGSTVYVLPIGGGAPKLITEATPSYWHGWSPSNKEVYTLVSAILRRSFISIVHRSTAVQNEAHGAYVRSCRWARSIHPMENIFITMEISRARCRYGE
ncbi:MAG: hypothetical protein WDO15_07595 [Bacteroidota bacterium]